MTEQQLEAQSWAYAENHDHQSTTGDIQAIQDGYKAGFRAARGQASASALKRYQVFCIEKYYPGGAQRDVVGEGEGLADAGFIAERALLDSFDAEIAVLDMEERRWLTPKEVKALVKSND